MLVGTPAFSFAVLLVCRGGCVGHSLDTSLLLNLLHILLPDSLKYVLHSVKTHRPAQAVLSLLPALLHVFVPKDAPTVTGSLPAPGIV